ncbi:MAG: response regulator transcription factor [Gemmatimonadota bacterium]
MDGNGTVRALVVDDDPGIVLLVRRALEEDGLVVEVERTGVRAERRLLAEDFDIALLDIEIPGKTGLEVLRSIRKARRPTLALMLTVRHHEADVVEGLDAGADDYLGKPFSVGELTARVRALLRRRAPAGDGPLEFGGIRVDRERRRVTVGDQSLDLTAREFDLLAYLIRQPHRVVPRNELLDRVWAVDFDPGTNVIDVHVSNLRRKLNRSRPDARIRTERGVGFALTDL